MGPRRVTLCGSFGLGNSGDEAAHLSVADLARAQGWPLSFDIVGRYPTTTETDVIALGPDDAPRRARLRGQPLLFVGGGIVEPKYSASVLRARPLIQEIQPAYRCLFAASADPLGHARYGWRIRLPLMAALQGCRRLFARDVYSGQTIRALAPLRRVEVVGDIVLWLEPDPAPPLEVAALGRYITVSLSPVWSGDTPWYDWLARQLAAVAKRLDVAVVFLPFAANNNDDDRVEHRQVADRIRAIDPSCRLFEIDAQPPLRQLAAIQEHAQLAIGMRLHACITAYARRTPCIGLTYHAKLLGLRAPWAWSASFPSAPTWDTTAARATASHSPTPAWPTATSRDLRRRPSTPLRLTGSMTFEIASCRPWPNASNTPARCPKAPTNLPQRPDTLHEDHLRLPRFQPFRR